jgi:hypothetical protein
MRHLRTCDEGMRFFLLLTAASALAQTPAHYDGTPVPDGMPPEKLFIRYILESEEVGGVVNGRAGVTDYLIATTRGDHAAARFKAILYAPGCSIQTIDVALPDANNPRENFDCRPARNTPIEGRLKEAKRLGDHEFSLQSVYVARWAQAFPGVGQVLVSIPVGDAADLEADGRFHISVPVLRDGGEIQIRAKDKATGDDIGQIVPVGKPEFKTRMGGLEVRSEYPGETVFTPCAIELPHLIDREGFDQRRDNACDR